ncbi:KdsC family phosphatase [Basilea psittacipulmonis]|uniref:3-deoxy-D-manno-octulosonate 8-phosphate phosphatase KdsC n=1 Tax=Basilea psittacipulmonis DSM 24701 TaxID=1072685 RepID=A0A077DBU3_9BURK|nr:HAD-IIIA family hydrolase [Basilea psittacipulmonis]AIL32129.1 3-deoxy-D-manno-octulosonate 8-phosphate phosphatase [Basilea psittacipulmonis DSM 24701]
MAVSLSHPDELLVLSRLSPELCEKAKKIRLLALDVDGILTDGGLIYSEHGESLKRFHALDGHGLKMLMESGIEVAILTGRSGEITVRRCAELGVSKVFQSVRNKAQLLAELVHDLRMDMQEVAFVGDDLIDMEAMRNSGLSISVPNAPIYVQNYANYVTSREGGRGAVREVADIILAAQHKLAPFFKHHLTGNFIQ